MNILLSIMIVALLSGCGGGGGSSSSSVLQAQPTTRAIITNTLRTFQHGDVIHYSLTGSTTIAGVPSVYAGTVTRSYMLQSPLDPLGNTHASETFGENITQNGTPLTASPRIEYYEQLANGTFLFWGRNTGAANNSSFWITSPVAGNVVIIKSPIVIGDTWQHTYIMQGSQKVIETITVNAKVIITVPMGSFEAIKITRVQDHQLSFNHNGIYSSDQMITIIDYIVPSIGIIKRTKVVNSVGVFPVNTYNFLEEMATTNIAF